MLFSKAEQLRYVNFADIPFFLSAICFFFQCRRRRMALKKTRDDKSFSHVFLQQYDHF